MSISILTKILPQNLQQQKFENFVKFVLAKFCKNGNSVNSNLNFLAQISKIDFANFVKIAAESLKIAKFFESKYVVIRTLANILNDENLEKADKSDLFSVVLSAFTIEIEEKSKENEILSFIGFFIKNFGEKNILEIANTAELSQREQYFAKRKILRIESNFNKSEISADFVLPDVFRIDFAKIEPKLLKMDDFASFNENDLKKNAIGNSKDGANYKDYSSDSDAKNNFGDTNKQKTTNFNKDYKLIESSISNKTENDTNNDTNKDRNKDRNKDEKIVKKRIEKNKNGKSNDVVNRITDIRKRMKQLNFIL
ncbi:hypothetical protein MHBO_002176 [Bonamia ostreae]